MPLNRRQFVASAALAVASLAAEPAKPKLKKAVKYAMIKAGDTPREKLELVKKLGFQGVEIDSPNDLDLKELNLARDATGIAIHGVIDSVHWRDPLSHPDPSIRLRGLAGLKTALVDAWYCSADTALLVPGIVGKDVNYEQCKERSQAEIRRALPQAEKLGVKIAIEVVWNNFITKPEQLVEYVDDFKSPFVGAYFDCSNMIRYGVKPADWIRALGPRMLKFDFKGFSMTKYNAKKDPWVGIGEGDEDWPEILKALAEVNYNGWATAEVAGGGEPELKDVAARMDKILNFAP